MGARTRSHRPRPGRLGPADRWAAALTTAEGRLAACAPRRASRLAQHAQGAGARRDAETQA
jgi:hypothetical protein